MKKPIDWIMNLGERARAFNYTFYFERPEMPTYRGNIGTIGPLKIPHCPTIDCVCGQKITYRPQFIESDEIITCTGCGSWHTVLFRETKAPAG